MGMEQFLAEIQIYIVILNRFLLGLKNLSIILRWNHIVMFSFTKIATNRFFFRYRIDGGHDSHLALTLVKRSYRPQ